MSSSTMPHVNAMECMMNAMKEHQLFSVLCETKFQEDGDFPPHFRNGRKGDCIYMRKRKNEEVVDVHMFSVQGITDIELEQYKLAFEKIQKVKQNELCGYQFALQENQRPDDMKLEGFMDKIDRMTTRDLEISVDGGHETLGEVINQYIAKVADPVKFHEYQIQWIDAAVRNDKAEAHQIVALRSGAGKSRMVMLAIVLKTLRKNICVFVAADASEFFIVPEARDIFKDDQVVVHHYHDGERRNISEIVEEADRNKGEGEKRRHLFIVRRKHLVAFSSNLGETTVNAIAVDEAYSLTPSCRTNWTTGLQRIVASTKTQPYSTMRLYLHIDAHFMEKPKEIHDAQSKFKQIHTFIKSLLEVGGEQEKVPKAIAAPENYYRHIHGFNNSKIEQLFGEIDREWTPLRSHRFEDDWYIPGKTDMNVDHAKRVLEMIGEELEKLNRGKKTPRRVILTGSWSDNLNKVYLHGDAKLIWNVFKTARSELEKEGLNVQFFNCPSKRCSIQEEVAKFNAFTSDDPQHVAVWWMSQGATRSVTLNSELIVDMGDADMRSEFLRKRNITSAEGNANLTSIIGRAWRYAPSDVTKNRHVRLRYAFRYKSDAAEKKKCKAAEKKKCKAAEKKKCKAAEKKKCKADNDTSRKRKAPNDVGAATKKKKTLTI